MRIGGNKAQSGLEYTIIFGFSLFIVSILWAYSGSNIENTKWDLQIAYAKSSLDKIVQAADVAYVQGPPAQLYIYPNFPDNVNRIYVNGHTVSLELLWKNTLLRNITASSLANITANVSTVQGTHKLLVKAFGNSVQISEP